MRKIILILIVLLAIVLVVAYFRPTFGQKISSFVHSSLSQSVDQLKTIEKSINLPPPLYGPGSENNENSTLTVDGVISETNKQRQIFGIDALPLSQNEKLTQAAEQKVDDMFARQYFEHQSPSGVSVDGLAKEVGYDYIIVGENLALGNFANDADLVQAWMNSPGHRANILNARFMEIGVAVKRGTFNGKTVWLAVQEFGRPASLCPGPNSALKALFQQKEKQTSILEGEIQIKRQQIENTPPRSSQYNDLVNEYNGLVHQYNSLVDETKALVNTYNLQVRSFNSCIEQ